MPVEVLFDVGLGDVFVVRTAGHVLSDSTLATLEYGAEHLGVKLLLVLGHEKCGAVNATHDCEPDDREALSAPMRCLVDQIAPAVEEARGRGGERDAVVACATELHVRNTVQRVRDELGAVLEHGRVSVVGGVYELGSGRVRFLEQYGKVYE